MASEETIDLHNIRGAQATALVVLEPQAYYAQTIAPSDWIIDFTKAKEITEKIDVRKFSEVIGKKPNTRLINAIGFAIRAKAFEELIDKYLNIYPDAVLVHLGCGMSDRSERYKPQIENGLPFFDVDFPDMIALRRHFYEETAHYKMIGVDLTHHRWIDEIPKELQTKPFIFVAEGVSPYLSEAEVKGLFAQLKENFPGCIFILDTYSQFKMKVSRKILKKHFNAIIDFTNQDPQEIVNWSPEGAYTFLEEDNLFLRKDLLDNDYFPRFHKALLRFFIRFFSWNKGIIRGTVVVVFQLGKH